LHFETVRISPEFALWVEPIKHLKVYRDILALLIIDWNGIEFNIELDESLHMFREQNFDERSFLITFFVNDGPLFNIVTLLIHNLGIDLTKLLWQRLLELW